MSLPLEREGDLAHHVYDSLEDEAAQPLRGLQEQRPDNFDSFTELETSVSEWSFGYGVAWALARVREPFASSRRVSEIAAQAVATAWRSFGDEPWRTLMAQDRDARNGPAGAREPVAERTPVAEGSGGPQLDDFMGGLARARRRPREGDEPTGEAPGGGPD